MSALRLIVGLGNPGPAYAETRHNAGARFVEELAGQLGISLREESKFDALMGRASIGGHDVRLLIPTTYMNLSGRAVGAVVNFYKMTPDEMLVAYDEMAFEPGQVRLKTGGGDNGHNGIRSIVSALGNRKNFHRLRIGVGHPGDRSRVDSYLTSARQPSDERAAEQAATRWPDAVLTDLVSGELQKVMNELHGRLE